MLKITLNIIDNNNRQEKTTILDKNKNEGKIEPLFEYLRVSTDKQDTQMQKEANRKFIHGKPFKIVASFEDSAKSGALGWERLDLKEMFDKLKNVKGILLYAWDRISREEEFAITLIYLLRKENKYVLESSTGLKLNFDEMHNRLIGMIKSVVAEDERLRIKKRQKDGIKTFKKKHKRWGRFKYYGKSESGKELTEELFWRKYELYRNAKISKSAIARLLKMTRTTLYKRLNENKEKYNEIE